MNTRHCENRDCINPQWDCRTCWFWMRERKEAAEAERDRLLNIKARICRDGGQASIEEAERRALALLEAEDKVDRLRAAIQEVEWIEREACVAPKASKPCPG